MTITNRYDSGAAFVEAGKAIVTKTVTTALPSIDVGRAMDTPLYDDQPERLKIYKSRSNRLFLVGLTFSLSAYFVSEGDPFTALFVLAVIIGCGWLYLVRLDNTYSPAMIERERNTMLYNLAVFNMQTNERLKLAEMGVNRMALSVQHVEAAQAAENGLALRLADWLLSLYDGGVDADGRITKTVLWSVRGGLSPSDRKEALRLVENWSLASGVWIVAQRKNGWYLNVDRLPTKEALRGCVGVCVGVHLLSDDADDAEE